MRHTHFTPRSGFTMIEMLIVFVVFGVSSMIAIRSVGETLRKDKLAKTAVIVSTDLEQAFAIAARQRTPVRLLFDTVKMNFSVASRADTTLKFRSRALKTGDLSVDYIKINRDTIDVMPNGLATDTV